MTNDAPAQASVEAVLAIVRAEILKARQEPTDLRSLQARIDNAVSALSPPPTVGAEDETVRCELDEWAHAWILRLERETDERVTFKDGYFSGALDVLSKLRDKLGAQSLATRPSPSAVEVKGTDAPMLSRNDVCRLWQHVSRERPNMTVEGFTNMLLCEIDDRSCIASEKGGL